MFRRHADNPRSEAKHYNMRPLTAIAILAAAMLGACTRYDGIPSTDLSNYQSSQPDRVDRSGSPTNMWSNIAASFTLTGIGSGDSISTPLDREPHRNPVPAAYSGVQRYPAGQDHTERQRVGISLVRGFLTPQNSVRAAVGEAPLVWSARLADLAQEWADHLIATGEFKHHSAGQIGENLYEIIGGTATPQHVVSAWTVENRDYDVVTNSCTGNIDCGHYTQIVWSTTRSVGCAVAIASNRQIWACEYYPAGNVIGYRPYRLAMSRR
jgi:pathogenesis-related protein 1